MSSFKNLKILHYHIGSQIEKLSDVLVPIKYALDIYFKLKEKNPSLDTLDIGGGMPIPYTRTKGYPLDKLMEKILRLVKKESEKRELPHPNLICEWGRYIVAPAQITVFKVIDTKTILHKKSPAKKWYVIDGSFMNDLPDTWAINQKWSVSSVNNKKDNDLNEIWFAGSSCDSDDIYKGRNGTISFPDFDIGNGDGSMYVAFYDTGAYQDPLSAHHCMLSSPLKIIVENGHVVVARKRETPDDVGKEFGW
jgi:arginine decarboxylase